MTRCGFRPLLAVYAAFLAAGSVKARDHSAHRRLDIEVVGSDEMAEAVMTASASKSTIGIGAEDHATIASILSSTRQLVETASLLVQNERTLKVGQEMMEEANAKLREVKDHIRKINDILRRQTEDSSQRELLRKKYSGHDVAKTQEDDARALDISRLMYETITTFPECVERFLADCLEIINADLADLGLAEIEEVIREKRNANQDNYYKVVIITNEQADSVAGRAKDGIVTYPYQWDDVETGPRTLGVDGKWNCQNMTPEDCCALIKESVPNPDTNENNIECHIFVPFGGVGNPRRDDRVFITLSSDGRVHEPPFIS